MTAPANQEDPTLLLSESAHSREVTAPPHPAAAAKRRRPAGLVILAFLVVAALAAGWGWHQREMASLRAELDAQTADLYDGFDNLYSYLDDIALRQQSVERVVRQSPDFAAVQELLEDSVVQVHTEFATGSGFPIDLDPGCVDVDCRIYEAEGYDTVIVTNYHVVSDAVGGSYEDRVVTVVGPDGSEAEGRVWAWDRRADLALIDLDRSDLDRHIAPLLWAPPGSTSVGDPVAVGGYPFGLEFILTTGHVTAKNPGQWETDAIISGGSSGSPLVDPSGRVVGVATSALGGITEAVDIESLCNHIIDC